jgi:predicted negative regulator of RcsB-dependent stress response
MPLNFRSLAIVLVLLLLLPCCVLSEPRGELALPAGTGSILDHIYSGRRDLALPEIHKLEDQTPDDPLGYLLEAEAQWWRIWCDSAEFKYGMTMARHHEKVASDQQYLGLTTKAYTLAQAKLKQNNSGEMHLYEAMADALSARLLAMRGEYRAAAHAGVRARGNFQAALELDPTLYDAYTGLGLYNYYVDALSTLAKALRFLMGIPGGTKAEGIRQLERGIREGQMSASLARFYLAMNLLNYDQKYEEALGVIGPLAEKYPGNPLFQLMEGDLNVKLGRRQVAETHYRAAEAAANEVPEAECRAKMKQLAQQSLASLGSN